jgi:hypothetical protein
MDALEDILAATPIQDKWGEALNAGFVVVPSALLRHQYQLKIDCNEMVVLVNLLMAWWKSEDLPYPRPATLANRMGVSARTVQRQIQSLEEKRLIKRIWVPGATPDDRAWAKYDLSGIVAKLKELGCDAHSRRKLTVMGEDGGTGIKGIDVGSPTGGFGE